MESEELGGLILGVGCVLLLCAFGAFMTMVLRDDQSDFLSQVVIWAGGGGLLLALVGGSVMDAANGATPGSNSQSMEEFHLGNIDKHLREINERQRAQEQERRNRPWDRF